MSSVTHPLQHLYSTDHAVEEHDGKVSINSRNINLQFAKDIDAVAEEEQEQETLVKSFNKT